jgi:hypothetical protein
MVLLSRWTDPFEEQYGQIVGWISEVPVPRQLGRSSQLEKSKTIIFFLVTYGKLLLFYY